MCPEKERILSYPNNEPMESDWACTLWPRTKRIVIQIVGTIPHSWLGLTYTEKGINL